MMDRYTHIDQLPLCLTVDEVARVLGIGKRQAYQLCHSKGFPCIKVGRRLIIPKPAFVQWMSSLHEKEG